MYSMKIFSARELLHVTMEEFLFWILCARTRELRETNVAKITGGQYCPKIAIWWFTNLQIAELGK